MLRIIATVVSGARKKENLLPSDLKLENVRPKDLEFAEKLLLLTAMPETLEAYDKQRLVSLNPQMLGNLVVSTGRIGEKSMSRLLGVPHLTILLPNTRAAYLYMVRAHEGEFGNTHNSIVATLAKSREKVWIIKGRNLAKKVVSSCRKCLRNKRNCSGQQMSHVKEENLTICRPWTHISLDFAGPFLVKGAVNARAMMKCWVVVYCCRSTKAVELLVTCGYDTQSFLLRHAEFVSRRGSPQTIVSDRGTQLVSAGRILANEKSSKEGTPVDWNWKRIVAENCASNWEFVPIGSPHFNGLPEATIKVLKKTLDLSLHSGVVLTYPEMVTLLSKIAYTVNSRPLGLANISQTSQQEDNMVPITPNMLLLGRSSNFSPPIEFADQDRFCARLAYVGQVEKEWWDRWIKLVLPTLFSYKRWKSKKKNLEVGELVMIRYTGQVKDDYCIGKVIKVHPSPDGLVRSATVSYRRKCSREAPSVYKSKPLVEERMAVHRLHRLELIDDDLAVNNVDEDRNND